MVLKATVQKQSSKQSLPKISLKIKCPEVHCRTLDSYSNQMIKYQLPFTGFDQISDHKQLVRETIHKAISVSS